MALLIGKEPPGSALAFTRAGLAQLPQDQAFYQEEKVLTHGDPLQSLERSISLPMLLGLSLLS